MRAAEDKRVRCVKAASETKERGHGEKKRSAREVVENASSVKFKPKSRLLRSVGSSVGNFSQSGDALVTKVHARTQPDFGGGCSWPVTKVGLEERIRRKVPVAEIFFGGIFPTCPMVAKLKTVISG